MFLYGSTRILELLYQMGRVYIYSDDIAVFTVKF